MGINLSKLEQVKYQGAKIIARCPACAESGKDRKGEHLFIESSGKFGCVVYPGIEGKKHRQRIFELAGINDNIKTPFKIKKPSASLVFRQNVIQKDILGHLGHLKSPYARKEITHTLNNENNKQEESEITVPSVPRETIPVYNENLFNFQERELLKELDNETIKHITLVKKTFNAKIIAVENTYYRKTISKQQKPLMI